jgi:hypothetical protein
MSVPPPPPASSYTAKPLLRLMPRASALGHEGGTTDECRYDAAQRRATGGCMQPRWGGAVAAAGTAAAAPARHPPCWRARRTATPSPNLPKSTTLPPIRETHEHRAANFPAAGDLSQSLSHNMADTGTRLVLCDPVMLRSLVEMGFAEQDARRGLERTSNRNLEVCASAYPCAPCKAMPRCAGSRRGL